MHRLLYKTVSIFLVLLIACVSLPFSAADEVSAGDPLSFYQWYLQSPGLSLNAPDAWSLLAGGRDEAVVAVIDTGINVNHEDLKNVLWTNPGNLGLPGEHGFNTQENNSVLTDLEGHGTHCAGIIAAQSGNGAGIAGVASAANVKIMMVATNHSDPEHINDLLSMDREIGALEYVLRAKQAGVNIVAVSCSWGQGGQSGVLDDILNRLGEEGILTFFAAGNEHINLDYSEYHTAGTSPYRVTVGAADRYGNASGFSNYGRRKVDLFAPGVNILSSVSYPCYFPNLWTPEKRSETTAYYGLFDENTICLEDGSVIPSVTGCDETVKPFGASVFRAQPLLPKEEGEPYVTGAVCELEIVKDHTFTDTDRPASLKVTIHNASYGEQYFLYFPYDKDPSTTGSDNTDLSVCVTRETLEGELPLSVSVGEILVDTDGNCELVNAGMEETNPGLTNQGIMTHCCNSSSGNDSLITGVEELEGRTCGVGVQVVVNSEDEDAVGDLHFYLDSIAVSRPGIELSADDAYDIMGGTSMATPAAAGACAVLASLYPRQEGQSGSEYALETRARLLSCVRMTEELKDLCASGGYLDLSLLGAENPALTRAVCDVDTGDVILNGINLGGSAVLSYRKTAEEGAQAVALPSGGMTVDASEDGSTLTIHNAKELFGSFVEFALSENGSVRAKLEDFLVKGQSSLSLAWEDLHLQEQENTLTEVGCILTDEHHDNLYGFDPHTGTLFRWDGSGFSAVLGTGLLDAAIAFLEQEGISYYDVHRNTQVTLEDLSAPVYTGNRLYHWITTEYRPSAEAEESITRRYLAVMDYTAAKPTWSFTETKSWTELTGSDSCSDITLAGLDGKIYCIGLGDDTPFMLCYDPAENAWQNTAALPVTRDSWTLVSGNGKIYALLGLENSLIQSRRCLDGYVFDGAGWEKLPEIPYAGDDPDPDAVHSKTAYGACTVTEDGLVLLNCPAEGGGNCFRWDPETGAIEPLYLSMSGYLPHHYLSCSAAWTREGVWLLEKKDLAGSERSDCLYLLPAGR